MLAGDSVDLKPRDPPDMQNRSRTLFFSQAPRDKHAHSTSFAPLSDKLFIKTGRMKNVSSSSHTLPFQSGLLLQKIQVHGVLRRKYCGHTFLHKQDKHSIHSPKEIQQDSRPLHLNQTAPSVALRFCSRAAEPLRSHRHLQPRPQQ